MFTGEATVSRGAGKGAGAPTWPWGSGSRRQGGVFGEASRAGDSSQESSGLPDFPAAGQPTSDPAE